MISAAEENYLKAIYHQSLLNAAAVSTGTLAAIFGIQAPSVTEMLKKMDDKGWVVYRKSRGVSLTDEGKALAVGIIRRHRIWETFLLRTLGFDWSEVHDLAEQLEHIRSDEIIDRLEVHLGFPKYDPHGDPIPSADGTFPEQKARPLTSFMEGEEVVLMGISDHSPGFLKYLKRMHLEPGARILIRRKEAFDGSVTIRVGSRRHEFLSEKAAAALLVVPG